MLLYIANFMKGGEIVNYEVNYDTQMILPNGVQSSKVLENGNEYIVDTKPFSIVEHSCEYFGSSYEGRKSGTKKLSGITHKAPIIIEESQRIIIFPTTSPDRDDCIWINLAQINKYYSSNKTSTTIEFKNGDKLEFNVSIGSITNQILRATRLKYILEERISSKKGNI